MFLATDMSGKVCIGRYNNAFEVRDGMAFD